MLKQKSFWALALGLFLLAAPVMAAEPSAEDAAYASVERMNTAFYDAFCQESTPIDAADFTNDALSAQMDWRNVYVMDVQRGLEVRDSHWSLTLDKSLKVDDVTYKFLCTRQIEQTLYSEASGEFPMSSTQTEGYVVKLVDGRWKIDRVIEGFHTIPPVLQAFIDTFDDPAAGLVGDGILSDQSGRDYVAIGQDNTSRVRVIWDGVEIIFPDQQPLVIDGVTMAPSRPIVAAMPGDYLVNVVQDKPWYALAIQPQDITDATWFEFYQGHDGQAAFYRVNHGAVKGEAVVMNEPVQIIGNRLMLPVRALVQEFADVTWDQDKHTVYITSKTA